MPTLSASEYTQFLKFRAAAATPIQPAIQTRDNVSLSQSLINATLLASQAALVVTPPTVTNTVLTAVVTDVSTTTVTAARTDILSAATADGSNITYTSSQAHGLTNGATHTISGFTGTLSPSPNRTGVVTVVNATTFTIPAVGAASGTATGTGSITNRVYYTTSVANGLIAGDTISVTDITTFTASGATVVAVPTSTTFVLTSATTGTAVSGASGSITGLVYYTTDVAHQLAAGTPYVTISGLTGTPAYNLSSVTLYRVPSSTTFVVRNSATGTAITSASGTITLTTYGNPRTVATQLGRVVGRPVVQTRSNPDAKSTLSWTSGTSGSVGSLTSSRTNVAGGLPTGFRNSQGTYHRIPQNAGWIQGGAGTLSSGPKRF